MENKKLKLYSGTFEDLEGSYSIVATSSNEAKEDFYKFNRENDWCDLQWTDIKIKLCKDWKKVDYTKLGFGVLEDQKYYNYLLSIGLCHCLFEASCPRCEHEETTIYHDKERGFYCDECEEISDEEIIRRKLIGDNK
jgi:hypothetical protein